MESFHDCKNPFLYLHIICPSGSYDANVEPAKDDVLFADTDFVITRLENFLKSIYGELQTPKDTSRPRPNSKPGGFDLLLARKPRSTETPPWTADYRGRKISSMNQCVGENVEDDRDNHAIDSNTVQRTQDSDDEEALRNVKISNPWTFAKIHASVRHSDTLKEFELQTNNQLLTPARQAGEPTEDRRQRIQEQRQSHVTKSGLPSPAHTQADHSTPSLAQLSPTHKLFSFPQKDLREKNDKDAPRKENRPQRGDDGADICNSWVSINKSGNNFLIPSATGLINHEVITEDETRRPQTKGRDFVSARTLPLGAPLNGIPELQADRIRGLMPRQRIGMNLHKGSFPPECFLPNIRLVRNDASACARSDSNSITDSKLNSSSTHHLPGRNRGKTSLLPLEAVREELATRNLVLVVPTAKLDINGLLAGLRSTTGTFEEGGLLLDEYIANGEFFGGFPSSENNDKSSMQSYRYESKIRALLTSVYGDEIGAKHEKLKFSSDLRASLAKISSKS